MRVLRRERFSIRVLIGQNRSELEGLNGDALTVDYLDNQRYHYCMSSNRVLTLRDLLKSKSHFLFGARGTGKSTAIKEQLIKTGLAVYIDLLDNKTYRTLLTEPELLEELVELKFKGVKNKWIVIDEVQKVPELLDEVHRLIEDKKWVFLLTGSNARKLKKTNANLLASRARNAEMFPFVFLEFKSWNLNERLQYGSLPIILSSDSPEDDLDAYVNLYLKEEILQEGIIRKIAPFSRFLTVAALSSGDLLNYAQVGSDAQVAPTTVMEHFAILEDTKLGFRLPPWTKSKKRKAIMTSKFYFFDCGVTNTLAGIKSIDRNSDLFGKRFEQLMINEVRAYNSYFRKRAELTFWREKNGKEVDLLINDEIAIEFKATRRVSDGDFSGQMRLKEENIFKKHYLVSHDKVERLHNGVECNYYERFLSKLWSGKIF